MTIKFRSVTDADIEDAYHEGFTDGQKEPNLTRFNFDGEFVTMKELAKAWVYFKQARKHEREVAEAAMFYVLSRYGDPFLKTEWRTEGWAPWIKMIYYEFVETNREILAWDAVFERIKNPPPTDQVEDGEKSSSDD